MVECELEGCGNVGIVFRKGGRLELKVWSYLYISYELR